MKDFISDAEMNSPEFISDEQMNDEGFIQGLKNAGKAVMYNSNRLGAGMAGAVAGIGEAVGVDMNASRDVQDWYQDKADEHAQPDKPFLQEAYNPLNYTMYGQGPKLAKMAVGSAVGNQVADVGMGKDIDTTGFALQAGIPTAIDSLFSGIGRATLAPRQALVGKGKDTSKSIDNLLGLSAKNNVDLTPATVTGSPSLAKLEQNINQGPLAGLGMRQSIDAERGGINTAIGNQFEKMGANGSNVAMGETMTQSLKSVAQQENQYFKNKFGRLFASLGDNPYFSTRGVKQEAMQLVEQADRVPSLKRDSAFLDAKEILKVPDDLSWNDWQAFRSNIGAKANDTMLTSKASKGFYKNLYSKTAQDLDSSVTNAPIPQSMVSDYFKTIGEYKTFKDSFGRSGNNDTGSNFINSVANNNVNPEAVGSMMNRSSLRAKSGLNTAGVDVATGVPIAKQVSATDALLASKARNGEDISLSAFLKQTGPSKEGFRTLAQEPNRVFGAGSTTGAPKTLQNQTIMKHQGQDVIPTRLTETAGNAMQDLVKIDELRDIATAIAKKDSQRNFSNTSVQNWMNTLKTMNPIALAATLVKELGISTLYNSKTFRSWLEKGVVTEEMIKQATQSGTVRKASIPASEVLLRGNNQ